MIISLIQNIESDFYFVMIIFLDFYCIIGSDLKKRASPFGLGYLY